MKKIVFSIYRDLEKKVKLSLKQYNEADYALHSFVYSFGHGHGHSIQYPKHLENKRLIEVRQEAYTEYKIYNSLLLVIQKFRNSNGYLPEYDKMLDSIDTEIQAYISKGENKAASIFQVWRNKFPKG